MPGDTDLLRKQIYLHRQQDQQLRRLARKNRMTESALIRKALAEYLAAEDRRSTPEQNNEKFKEQDLSITDACSAIFMQRERIDQVASFDRHFRILGFPMLPE